MGVLEFSGDRVAEEMTFLFWFWFRYGGAFRCSKTEMLAPPPYFLDLISFGWENLMDHLLGVLKIEIISVSF